MFDVSNYNIDHCLACCGHAVVMKRSGCEVKTLVFWDFRFAVFQKGSQTWGEEKTAEKSQQKELS